MLPVNSLAIKGQEGNPWELCQDVLRTSLGEGAYYAWIETLEYLRSEGSTLVLGARNDLSRDWVERHYLAAILDILQTQAPHLDSLRFEVRNAASQPKLLQLSAKDLVEVPPVRRAPAVISATPRSQLHGVFYPNTTFENFVIGECNRMAYSVAHTVAETPGENHYNPLVLYGRSGLGKTHLLQSIGRYAMEHGSAHNVLYCSAEKFLKDFMQVAMKESRPQDFYRAYESADILIIDDLQVLVGKVRTQEELFKVFHKLLGQKKQIVLSCDQLPSEIAGLDQRLLNRFDCGLCCSLNPMDLQTRLDFLHRKAASQGLCLSEDSFRWLASHFRSNVRELEGVLVKLVGLREIMGMELSLDTIRRMVGEVVRSESSRSLSLASISEACAIAFGVKPEVLATKSRVASIALPRKVAIKLCRELTDHSLEAIGFQFNRDYSTIIASLKSIQEHLDQDEALRDQVEAIRRQLLG